MKKTYISPSLVIAELNAEQMLALSVGVEGGSSTGGSNAWSNHKAWDSENFMPQEEVEE